MKTVNEMNGYVGYKVEIHPTEEQKSIFNKYFGTARFVYNLGIDIQLKNKKEAGKFLKFFDLCKKIVELKNTEEYSWLKGYDSAFIKLVLQDVCVAFENRLSNPKKYGNPKYKSKKKSRLQFPIRIDNLRIEDDKVFISSIGYTEYYNSYGEEIIGNSNTYWHKDIKYLKYTNPRISKKGSRYYLSVSVPKDEDHNINSYESYYGNHQWQEQESSKAIGIDVGLRHDKWLKDSTGRTVKRPKCEKENERLKFYQRKLDRQYETNKAREPRTFKNRQPLKDGISKNMQKTKDKINKLYDKITNKRRNAVHEYCKELLEQKPEAVVMEDIKVLAMVEDNNRNKICDYQKRKCNELLYDAALYDTKIIIENTMVNNGIKVIYADRNYPSSQICSRCGHIHKINVNTKYYRCPECGMVMDRDFNAAINLSKLAYLKCPVKRLEVE